MKTLTTALKIFLFFTILTGLIYPLLITGIAQLAFPSDANGSLVIKDHKISGSKLIGQQFDTTIYFNSRPSAVLYNPLPSGGTNYGINSLNLRNLVADRKRKFQDFNRLDSLTIVPSEMLFASASGLDPHISPEAAILQVDRIAEYRHFTPEQHDMLIRLVKEFTKYPQFHLFGQERINVFLLNLNLDNIK
jgi:potassium-transporting ATPase KdpC subunit